MEDYEEERMFTCLTEEGNRVDGAIEGTKEQVLSWMQNAFPGLRKSEDQEVDTIWAFLRLRHMRRPMETRCTLQSPSLRLSLQGKKEWRELRVGNVADFFFRWTQFVRKKGICS